MYGASIVYKCRRCARFDKSTHAPDGHRVLFHILSNTPVPEEWLGVQPGETQIHHCPDGNIGVADIIGCEFDDTKADTTLQGADYEQTWKEFWGPIVTANGVVNIDQVKRELYDFHVLTRNVSRVYDHVTGGNLSKPLTDPKAVMHAADKHYKWIWSRG